MTTQPRDYDLRDGDTVQDHLGHWYRIQTATGPRSYVVQPLTMVGTALQPFGRPVRMGRSEIRTQER